ncbi:MAG: hypothetical protein DRP96_10200 [Candidatus Neomarinimicrobiota bacterium]|nr:MAG: hypothetical protein DRP96_10200 [Candidatus Neomarinimicrobiota bacterium]
MKIKIISNIYELDNICINDYKFDLYKYSNNHSNLISILKIFLISFRYDYILLNCVAYDVIVLAFLKLICPINPCKLISMDIVLRAPTSFKDKIFQIIRIILFKRVYLFIEFFKNTSGYEKYFKIEKDKFKFVPFKVNSYELIKETTITDQGYIFCGGRSLRDFSTLIEAMRNLDFHAKIVTQSNSIIQQHGTFLNEDKLPANIEIIRHDGNQKTFIKYIAASKLVVIPLLKDTIAAAGISVYLMSMALKKCTILSDLPGVIDVLGYDKAIVVPPEDPLSLRQAILRAYNDDIYRRGFEINGYKYAIELGGDRHLYNSIAELILKDFAQK